jgi:hypothetical protein
MDGKFRLPEGEDLEPEWRKRLYEVFARRRPQIIPAGAPWVPGWDELGRKAPEKWPYSRESPWNGGGPGIPRIWPYYMPRPRLWVVDVRDPAAPPTPGTRWTAAPTGYMTAEWDWNEWRGALEGRIRAVENGMELHRFGRTPAEDVEVSDFATHFVKDVAPRHLMPEIPSRLCGSCINIPIRWLLESPRNGYTLFEDFQKLKESEKSCDLCKLILRSIESLEDDGVKEINIAIAPQFLTVEVVKPSGFVHRLLRLCAEPGKRIYFL